MCTLGSRRFKGRTGDKKCDTYDEADISMNENDPHARNLYALDSTLLWGQCCTVSMHGVALECNFLVGLAHKIQWHNTFSGGALHTSNDVRTIPGNRRLNGMLAGAGHGGGPGPRD
jgi:hypothetical protein